MWGSPQGVSVSLPFPSHPYPWGTAAAVRLGWLGPQGSGTAGWGWGCSHCNVLGFSFSVGGGDGKDAVLGNEPEEEMGNQHGEFVCYQQECYH